MMVMPRAKKVMEIARIEKKWLSSSETKRYLDCSDNYLQKLREEAQVSFSRYGGKFWYELSSIDRFIQKHRVV